MAVPSLEAVPRLQPWFGGGAQDRQDMVAYAYESWSAFTSVFQLLQT